MKLKNVLLALGLICSLGLTAQEAYPPTEIIVGTFIGKTIPLRDFPVMTAEFHDPKAMTMVPNESNTQQEANNTTTVIQNLQTEPGQIEAFPLEQNFIGASASESGFFPPDPTGAVGPAHYVHSVNSLVKIFDKTGTLLVGPVSLSAFLGIPSNNGDPIVLYDQLADRWVVSEFGALNNSLAIGVSETSDPTGAYNVWQYQFSGFPDYPHYGVWHDGYYGTVNLNGQTTQGFVMERDVMLAGGANPQILIFNLPGVVVNPNQVKSPEPANLLGTTIDPNTPGYITYLQDDAWNGVSFDHLKVWEIDMDWGTVGNSTISAPLEITTDPFDAGELFGNGNGSIHQPGTAQRLAGHGGIISFAANYRSFGSHNSWLITFNTFIDANETGGIRWIELRNDAVNPWVIFQEGTYSIADGHSRVMSSSAMDAAGNIGLAYTTASTTLAVSLRYTGRFDGDPLGQMTLAETTIIDGPGVRTNSNRYGDYSHMTMDPDNFTFWYTGDYFSSNNQWRTQIASFSLSGGFTADVGVSNIAQPSNGILTNAETVEVSIRNFGSAPQSNIPVELRVDGNLVASEVFTGPVAANSVETYTFAQTVDLSTSGQTYAIEARTNLAGDEFAANDPFTKNVTHLLANDVGALEITAPVSGSGLSNAETISVTLKNYGAATQSNFDVQYVIDGGTPVVETFAGPILAEEEISFDFATTADFSALGTYNVSVSTALGGDMDATNDEATAVIENVLCQPQMDCSFGDGFQLVSIAEINNVSGCEGYGDFTAQVANLGAGGTYDITFTTGYGDQNVKVWIDFNDDFTFTNDEVVVPNFVIAPGQASGSYTVTVDLIIPANAAFGQHRMRAKSNWQAPVPNDPCEETQYGETEDYSANIGDLGLEDIAISESDLNIVSLPNNQFEVVLKTSFDGGVYLGVYNVLGQELAFNKRVPRNDGAYRMSLDMSKVSSGVYLIKIGGQTTTSFKTGRIIVK
ncbi:MAG: T9SS type A sorting domain-containing protein [Altibacter sp.]|uniref:GEVED domain-containing protein n=1 Tax=Altibacter sp. TaxID=2024823 RepID=UPI001D2C5A7F|nr:GEVED domain-containing protein [Altibacter sp.]MBZ0328314.1 T9SS type A sorting domain-containing protein [Altibacter sp.]